MLAWFRALMPKEDRFFDLFERHAATLVDGAASLRALLDGTEAVPAACAAIAAQEDAADTITRDALLAVRRTFITPFDRGDIQALVGSLDDAIDQMLKTAKAVQLFEVTAFDPAMREMGDGHPGGGAGHRRGDAEAAGARRERHRAERPDRARHRAGGPRRRPAQRRA